MSLLCKVENCDLPVRAKGFCRLHYSRFRTHGEPEPTVTKTCEHCGQAFTVTRGVGGPTKRKTCSTECLSARERSIRDTRYKATSAHERVGKAYGLSAQDYGDLMARPCSICGEDSDRPHLDHSHDTGRYRDSLCQRCNLGLGHFRDNRALLAAASRYLWAHHPEPQEGLMPWSQILGIALAKAMESPDPSTQTGAILAMRTEDPEIGQPLWATASCNTFPDGVCVTPERLERPLKYQFISHAEESAVFAAAIRGIPTAGLVMVAPWAACHRCAGAIVGAGLSEVITLRRPLTERWTDSIAIGDILLAEAGVELTFEDPPAYFPPVRFDGSLLDGWAA